MFAGIPASFVIRRVISKSISSQHSRMAIVQ